MLRIALMQQHVRILILPLERATAKPRNEGTLENRKEHDDWQHTDHACCSNVAPIDLPVLASKRAESHCVGPNFTLRSQNESSEVLIPCAVEGHDGYRS